MTSELNDAAAIDHLARRLAYSAVCQCRALKNQDVEFEMMISLVTVKNRELIIELLEQEREHG
jgi:hypothetical protein